MPGPSIDLSFVKEYEDDVHTAYQRMGSKCRATVRSKNNVVGESTTFQKVGKGTATSKARHGEVPPMNIDHSPVLCALSDHYAGDYIDKLDELKIAHDEYKVIVNAGAYALGRKTDSLIIDQATTTTSTEGGSGLISTKRVLAALEVLQDSDVPMDDGDLYGWMTQHQWAEMLNANSQFTNADYVNVGEFENGGFRARDWLNVKWQIHTGLPGVGTASAECLIWHKTALGHASGADVTTDMQWIGPKVAHWVNSYMSQGAKIVDVQGVVKIPVNDTTPLS
mgnify:CR=1 FL=1